MLAIRSCSLAATHRFQLITLQLCLLLSPFSRLDMFVQVYTSSDGICKDMSFSVQGCAPNQAAYKSKINEIGKKIDLYLTEDTCTNFLWNGTDDIFAKVFYSNGYIGPNIVADSANVSGMCSFIGGRPLGTGK